MNHIGVESTESTGGTRKWDETYILIMSNKTANENTQNNMPSGTMNSDSPSIAGDVNSVLTP